MARSPIPLLLFAVVLAASSAPAAAVEDLFSVHRVVVDATAESAQAAKDQALVEGQRRALRQLFEKLTLPSDHERLPAITNDMVEAMTRGYELADERRSPQRYVAELSVWFVPERVREALNAANIPHAEAHADALVVLPVLAQGTTARLWDDPNPWRDAWRRASASDGLIDIVLPLGELADVMAVDAEQAVAGDREALAAIATRYRMANTLVAIADYDPSGNGTVKIAAHRYGGGGTTQLSTEVAGEEGMTAEALLETAVRRVIARLEGDWKEENLLPLGGDGDLVAEVQFSGLDDWLAIKRRLDRLARVRAVEIVELSVGYALVRLTFAGTEIELVDALGKRDLALVREPLNWRLRDVNYIAPAAVAPMAPFPPAAPAVAPAPPGPDQLRDPGEVPTVTAPPVDDLLVE